MQTISLFLLLAGFVIGLGAVTVIDLHGFLGRKSSYWTLATIRTHKITKPLIWVGTFLCVVGGVMFYKDVPMEGWLLFHIISLPIMILNGVFLSFYVSPYLLNMEKQGKSEETLPQSLQNKITASFIISFVSWWGNLFILACYISNN
ncbi:MAG: hypothetical protein KBC44_01700 [Candidatus Pacebacteria bacterium]|nr:hypothetical protein [Candidatus Paceibacterota bacterium]